MARTVFWRLCDAAVEAGIRFSKRRIKLIKAWQGFLCGVRCRCVYRGICQSHICKSPACRNGGADYCRDFHRFEMHLGAVLVERFGYPVEVAPWGLCIVIFDEDFTRGWRRVLLDRGYDAHFDYLDGRLAAFVPLNKPEAAA